MTWKLNRRDALLHLGLGTAGLLCLPRGAGAAGAVELAGLAELAERIRRASREQAFDVAAAAIRAGAGYQALLVAAFVAGVHDVRPRGVGGKLHCVMMVESAFQLATGASGEEAWLAALWAIDDFKRSQERDRRGGGDWVLPPRPEVTFASADLEEVFEESWVDGAFIRLEQRPENAPAFLARMRHYLVRKAFQSHQYKYVAAVDEESALAHPRWRSRLLAPAVTYVRAGSLRP